MKPKAMSLSVLALIIISGLVQAMVGDQPNMTAARTALQQARAELNLAQHNKSGHRAKAIEYVNAAIGEINQGIDFDRRHNHAGLMTRFPDQPHMKAAVEKLFEAKASLELATPDKGGHRAKAIDLVNKAIEEVNQGIAAAS